MLRFAFYKAPGDWRDRAIRLATWSRYSHVEFVLGEVGKDHHWGVTVSASKRDGNRVRLAEPYQLKPGRWDFVEIEGDYKRAKAFALEKAEAGVPYSTLGAVLSITPCQSNRDPDRLFCSEFMGLICLAGGVDIPDPHTLTPKELMSVLLERGATLTIT